MSRPSSIEGRIQPDFKPNDHVASFIGRAMAEVAQLTTDGYESSDARTELDSHVNMVVVGCHAYILNNSG